MSERRCVSQWISHGRKLIECRFVGKLGGHRVRCSGEARYASDVAHSVIAVRCCPTKGICHALEQTAAELAVVRN